MNALAYRMMLSRQPDSLTVHLSGEIDYAASLELAPKLTSLARDCPGELLFDLGNVTLLDSEGLKLLLAVFELNEGRAKITRCSKSAARVVQLSGMHEILGLNANA